MVKCIPELTLEGEYRCRKCGRRWAKFQETPSCEFTQIQGTLTGW